MKIRLDQIRANSWNSNFMDQQEQEALKQRMHETGPEKTLPLIVRLMPDGSYELIDGEHRWTIAKELGWEKIAVIIRETNDLQAKACCISYNKLRGRFNWFKLCDVLRQDFDNGVNLEEAYKDALSSKELKWILSLSNLVPQARLTLENSLKKYPEYTLEQLHLMSKLPPDQQESLSETYKKPIATYLLTRLLTAFLQKNQPQHSTTKEEKHYQPNNPQNQTANPNSNTVNHDQNDFTEQTDEDKCTPLDFWQSKWHNNYGDDEVESEDQVSQTSNPDDEQALKNAIKERALLVAVEHSCDCGRLYQVNFKKKTIVVQKENTLYEHVDFQTYTFLVHCDKCDNDREVKINNTENNNYDEETELTLCNRCNPVRKGWVNANTGEVTWL
jgi:hypothetical protein